MNDPSHPAHDHWVFGYGSLMWNPGFPFAERVEARLIGAHRALCVYSFHHRGTQQQPGLVLGLDLGGSCRGVAYRVAGADWHETHAYLTAREQISGVYRESARRIHLLDGSQREAAAVVYLVDRAHPQYAKGLDLEAQFRLVRAAHGKSGANRDYVLSTVGELKAMGIIDPGLGWIAHKLREGHE
ncbi:gamma-glutamylcyclotransferase [Aquabacter sp. CN5-332]|uniref:gamma-glutamylcyclotransferase n=1 Tax=Aquabacter sp. CN5-332 TaxID=3156608 RepID=UPI0032B56071